MEHVDVISALAPRLAVSLGMVDRAIIHAPQEFFPIETTRRALEQTEGPGPRTVVTVRAASDVESLAAALRDQSGPLLVEWYGLDEQLDELLQAVLAAGDCTRVPQHSIIVAAAVDRRPGADLDAMFDVVLGSSSLVIDSQTLAEIGPAQAVDSAWRFRALRVTGGVPALLEAFLLDLDAHDDRDLTQQWVRMGALPAPGRSADAAAAWADRAYPRLADEPLVLLHAWAYFISEPMMAGISSYLLNRRITPAEVRRARLNGAITRPGTSEPGFPILLAAQLVERMMIDPDSPARLWRRRLRMAMADRTVPVPDAVRICILTMIRDWSLLDRVLAASMHILATFASNERLGLADAWGDQVPAVWTHIAYAREFLLGTWRPNAPFLPLPWLELAHLVDGEDEQSVHPLIKELRGRLALGLSTLRPDSVEDVRRFALSAESVLTEHVSRHLEACTRHRRLDARFTDDSAVLAMCPSWAWPMACSSPRCCPTPRPAWAWPPASARGAASTSSVTRASCSAWPPVTPCSPARRPSTSRPASTSRSTGGWSPSAAPETNCPNSSSASPPATAKTGTPTACRAPRSRRTPRSPHSRSRPRGGRCSSTAAPCRPTSGSRPSSGAPGGATCGPSSGGPCTPPSP